MNQNSSYKPFVNLHKQDVPEERLRITRRMSIISKEMLRYGWRGENKKYKELCDEMKHLSTEYHKTFVSQEEREMLMLRLKSQVKPIWNGSYTEWYGWGFPGRSFNWNNNEEHPYGIY